MSGPVAENSLPRGLGRARPWSCQSVSKTHCALAPEVHFVPDRLSWQLWLDSSTCSVAISCQPIHLRKNPSSQPCRPAFPPPCRNFCCSNAGSAAKHARFTPSKSRTSYLSLTVNALSDSCPGQLRQRPRRNLCHPACSGARSKGQASSLRIHPAKSSEEIVLKDALTDQQFLTHLLDAIANRASWPGVRGQIRAVPTSALQSLWQPSQGPLTPSVMNAEQSNSSVVYDKRLVLKIFRRVEPGLNPDLEIGVFLTEKSSFRNVPPLAGYLEYLDEAGSHKFAWHAPGLRRKSRRCLAVHSASSGGILRKRSAVRWSRCRRNPSRAAG